MSREFYHFLFLKETLKVTVETLVKWQKLEEDNNKLQGCLDNSHDGFDVLQVGERLQEVSAGVAPKHQTEALDLSLPPLLIRQRPSGGSVPHEDFCMQLAG